MNAKLEYGTFSCCVVFTNIHKNFGMNDVNNELINPHKLTSYFDDDLQMRCFLMKGSWCIYGFLLQIRILIKLVQYFGTSLWRSNMFGNLRNLVNLGLYEYMNAILASAVKPPTFHPSMSSLTR